MGKIRMIFVVIWSVLSVIGMLLPDYHLSYAAFFLLGFHTPRDSIFFMGLYALLSDSPYLALVSIAILVVFMSLLIIALVRLKKSYLFERLFIADTILSLIRMSISALILKDNFNGWEYLIGLIAVNMLYICLYIAVRHNKRKVTLDKCKDNKCQH